MYMKNPYSPAIRNFRGQLTTCPNTKSQVPRSHGYNEAIAAVRIVQRRCLYGTGCCRCCRVNSAGIRGAMMTRIGRDRQHEKLEHQRLQCSEQFFLSFEHLFARIFQCCCLRTCERPSEREDECELHRASLLCCVPFLSSLMSCQCCVDLSLFASLDTVTARYAHPQPLSHSDRNSSRLATVPWKTDRVTLPSYPLILLSR